MSRFENGNQVEYAVCRYGTVLQTQEFNGETLVQVESNDFHNKMWFDENILKIA